jgi:hypothetical protein
MADSKGFKTDLKSTDPETGQMTWSVEYTANYGELFKEVSELLADAKAVALKSKGEPFFQDYYNDVRKLKNNLRTYLRNQYPEEYAKIKGVDEISTTGGEASFTPGKGAQYATPFAFSKKKKPVNYYYKLGYKPVDTKKLRKDAKGIEVKDLWK